MLVDVDAALKASPAQWFRTRTCREYGVVRAALREQAGLSFPQNLQLVQCAPSTLPTIEIRALFRRRRGP